MATLASPSPTGRKGRQWARDRLQPFYLSIGIVALGAIAVGFSTTYFGPIARREFHGPLILHIHGLFALSWIVLFMTQSLLVRQGATKVHMRLGIAGFPIAVGVLVTGMMVAHWTVVRDLPTRGAAALSGVVGTFMSLLLFLAFAAAALAMRRKPDWHKRLMLLATLVVWWPAWFRWRHLFTGVPRPDLIFGLLIPDLPMLIAAVRDKVRYGSVHPVWKFIAPAVFAEQLFETLTFNTGYWPVIGEWLYRLS